MSPDSVRRHQAVYRRLVAVTPPSHRSRHGEEQVALFGDLLRKGERPSGLWIRALPDLIRVFGHNKEGMLNHSARLALGTMSLAPIFLGLIVAWISIDEYDDVSLLFPMIALALLAQGGFTILWLTGRLARWQTLANDAFVVGEVAALLVGVIAVAGTVATQRASDPEYAPILIGVVIATHALIGLLAMVTSSGETPAS